MQRYFVSETDFNNNQITGSDTFHIIKVMRNVVGDNVEVAFNGSSYLVKLTNLSLEAVNYEIISKLSSNEEKLKITLIQGLPKGDKTDDIIKHSTELGVSEIILANMKRSIAKIEEKKLDNRLERFNKIAKEASEQSHRDSLSLVTYANSLKVIDYSKFDLCLLLDEEEAKKENPEYINNLDFSNIKSLCFIVGPEGGIDNAERDFLISKGFKCIALTKYILRTETASLSMLAQIDYKLRG